MLTLKTNNSFSMGTLNQRQQKNAGLIVSHCRLLTIQGREEVKTGIFMRQIF